MTYQKTIAHAPGRHLIEATLIGHGDGCQRIEVVNVGAFLSNSAADRVDDRLAQSASYRKWKWIGVVKMVGVDGGFGGADAFELVKAKQQPGQINRRLFVRIEVNEFTAKMTAQDIEFLQAGFRTLNLRRQVGDVI